MQDGDHVSRSGALKVLIAPGIGVDEKSTCGVGKECLRTHFRTDRLREDVAERQTKNVRAEIVDVGHAAKIMRERSFRVEASFCSALVHSVQPAVEHT